MYVLELGLESIPRDSRYSSNLIELMKREEFNTKEGNVFSNHAKDISARVDENLSLETRQFFHSVTQHNVKKWIALLQKFDKERGKIRSIVDNGNTGRLCDANNSSIDYTTEMIGESHNGSVSLSTKRGAAGNRGAAGLSKEQLDAEILRLEEDYNDNWLHYEKFSLKEAFKSQLARIGIRSIYTLNMCVSVCPLECRQRLEYA